MFADLSLENRALKDVIEKALKPAFKRELVTHLITTFELSIRQACRSLNLSWSVDFMHDARSVAVVFACSMSLMILTVRHCRLKSI